MTRPILSLFGALSFLASAGCAAAPPPEVHTPEQTRKTNEEGFKASSLERAAFDLRCDKAAVRAHALNALPGVGAQMGVECGGRRMVYVFKQIGTFRASWVAETASLQP